jgi:hypothetical protein
MGRTVTLKQEEISTRPLVREGALHGQDSNFQTRRNIYPSSRQRGRPTWAGQQLSNKKKYLAMSPRRGSTPRQAD